MKRLAVLFLFLLMLGSIDQAMAQEISLNKAQIQSIEHATFTDMKGNQFSMSDYHGKVVMIDFWATWCGPCVNSMPTNDKLVREYPKKFAVIAVAPGLGDSKEKVESFINKHDYKFKYAYGGQLARKLQIVGIPYKVFVSPDGQFIKVIQGSYGVKGDYDMIKGIINKYSGSGA